MLTAFWRSIQLSFTTAAIGAVFGAVLAYLVATGPADGWCGARSPRWPGCWPSSAG